MKVVVKYVSERGLPFDTPQEAITHDEYLPNIISTYEEDLKKSNWGKKIGPYDRILCPVDYRRSMDMINWEWNFTRMECFSCYM